MAVSISVSNVSGFLYQLRGFIKFFSRELYQIVRTVCLSQNKTNYCW